MEIVIASNNVHKLAEIRELLPDSFRLIGLKEVGIAGDLPETGDTFEQNALQKARFVYAHTAGNCLSDDSGLVTDALHGAPGVFSARYAGANATSSENVSLLLSRMEGNTNRKASFRAVLALIMDGKEYIFEGEIKGSIALKPGGNGGFGYDPVFIPENYDKPFAALPADVKRNISHRARAVKKLAAFLNDTLKG